MPEYVYQGVDKAGARVKGQLTAASEGDLRMILRGMGVRPTKVQSAGMMQKDLGSIFGGGDKVTIGALVTFTRQLNVLISSGIPLVQALDVLQEQTQEKSLKNIIAAMKEKIAAGSYFWEALSAYPKAFPKLYIALIRAGEAAGAMDQVMKRLSRYLEDADRLKKMLKSAMMYPVIVVGIGVGVIALMMIFVIPKFEEMLTTSGQELPLPTKIVLDLSHFFVDHVILIFGGSGAVIFLLLQYIKSNEGKAFLDRVLFKAPLFGIMMQKSGVARFSRTMQTLLASGVNLIDSIDICKATVDNAVLEQAISTIRADIESGKTLGSVVNKLEAFPKMAVQMITVGEATGNLDKMLEKVADFYEAEVETLIAGLTKLIEPLILVFLGGTIGGLLIAMYLPIFKLAGGGGE